MVDSTEVLVVGAGPTGLVLALSLLRAGVVPRIVDAKAGTGTESRALAVQARTLEYYRQLGIADEVVAGGVQIRDIQVRTQGRVAASINVDGFGAGLSAFPFVLCYPQDQHEKLLETHLRAAGVRVKWGTTLVAVTDTGEGATATLTTGDGARREVRAAYICGCDGPGSIVRREMGLGFAGATIGPPLFRGRCDSRRVSDHGGRRSDEFLPDRGRLRPRPAGARQRDAPVDRTASPAALRAGTGRIRRCAGAR